jgi:hypothetical protein
MASLNGVASVVEANACIVRVYSPTWTKVHAQHNCVNGSEVRFGIDSKHFWEAKKIYNHGNTYHNKCN